MIDLFGSVSEPQQQCSWPRNSLFSSLPINCKIAGTTFSEAKDRLHSITADMKFDLVRIPKNPFDKNAIAVFGLIDGSDYIRIGYIPKEVACKIAPIIDGGREVRCLVTEILGSGMCNIGVRVCLY